MNEQLEIFYNTTKLSGLELKESKMRTGSQNKLILDFFRAHPNYNFTPWDVQRYTGSYRGLINTPITSIRCSLTTLTDLGHLVKTDIKRPGIYNADCFCWRLK